MEVLAATAPLPATESLLVEWLAARPNLQAHPGLLRATLPANFAWTPLPDGNTAVEPISGPPSDNGFTLIDAWTQLTRPDEAASFWREFLLHLLVRFRINPEPGAAGISIALPQQMPLRFRRSLRLELEELVGGRCTLLTVPEAVLRWRTAREAGPAAVALSPEGPQLCAIRTTEGPLEIRPARAADPPCLPITEDDEPLRGALLQLIQPQPIDRRPCFSVSFDGRTSHPLHPKLTRVAGESIHLALAAFQSEPTERDPAVGLYAGLHPELEAADTALCGHLRLDRHQLRTAGNRLVVFLEQRLGGPLRWGVQFPNHGAEGTSQTLEPSLFSE